jgi:hypothetical protein
MSDVFQLAAQQQLSSGGAGRGGGGGGVGRRGGDSSSGPPAADSDSDDDSVTSDDSTAASAPHSRAEPSFAAANFSTILPEYRNRGQDAVKMAFQPGSFSSIRDLPDQISFTSVEHTLYDKAASNLHNPPVPVATRKMGHKNLFSQFQYMPETYDLKKELAAQEEREKKDKRLAIGRGHEFQPAAVIEKKLPGQDHFLHENSLFYNDERLKNKHKWQADPIERFQEMLTRERLAKMAANVNPAFCPGGKDEKVDTTMPSRTLLPDILRALTKNISRDWPDLAVRCYEEKACIVVEFGGVDPGDTFGVTAYMNIFHRKNPVAVRFKLSKNALGWNQSSTSNEKGSDTLTIKFSMRPPWIRGADLLELWQQARAIGNAQNAVQ